MSKIAEVWKITRVKITTFTVFVNFKMEVAIHQVTYHVSKTSSLFARQTLRETSISQLIFQGNNPP